MPGTDTEPAAPAAAPRRPPWQVALAAATLVGLTALAVVVLSRDGPPPLEERWRVTLDGAPAGGVVTVGDLALVTTADGDLVAIDAASGTPRWRFLSGQPATAPLAAGGELAVLTTAAPEAGSTVFAVDLRTGEERWRTVTEAAVTDAPVSDATGVYVSQGEVVALDPAGGAERWRQEVEGGAGALAAGSGTVVATAEDGLVALDAGTGALRWSSGGGRPEAAPGIVGDLVVVAADGDGLVARALDRGGERWRVGDVGVALQRVLPGREVAVAVTDRGLVGLGVADGTERWRAGPSGDDGLRASTDGWTVAAATGERQLFVDGVTGAVLASGRWARPGGDQAVAPAVVDGDVVVHDADDEVVALRLAPG